MFNSNTINKVLCIQNYGISGTTLMHSLLDGHHQLLTLPGLYGREAYEIWMHCCGDTPFVEYSSYKNLIEYFAKVNPKWFNLQNCPHGLDRLGESKKIRLEISHDFFLKKMNEYCVDKAYVSRKDFIVSLFYVFNDYYKRPVSEKTILVFPIHSLPKEVMSLVCADFKHVYVLHMIREPIQNIGSLIKHITVMTPETTFTFTKGLLNCAFWQILLEKSMHWSLYGIRIYGKFPYYPDRIGFESRSINLEDIHLRSRVSMEKICNWLKIEWSDDLLKSEFMGYPWHNRPESVEQQGLGIGTISQNHYHYMNKFDKWRLEIFALSERKYFGYISKNQHAIYKLRIPLILILIFIPYKCEILQSRIRQQFSVGNDINKFRGVALAFKIIFHNFLNYLTLRLIMVYKLLIIILSNEEKEYIKKF